MEDFRRARLRCATAVAAAQLCASAILLTVLPLQAQEPVNSLEALIEQALVHNPELLAARERIAESAGLLRQAGLRPNPGIDVSVSNGDALGSAGERGYEIGYSHPIELGGKRTRRIESARLAADLARVEIADRERLLRASVRVRYAEALAAMRNLGNAQRVLDLTRQSFELAQARTREGEGSPLEQGLLQVETNRIDADRTLFQSQVERAVLELRLLSGMDQGGALTINERLSPPAAAIESNAASEITLRRRPDLAGARIQEALAEAEISMARAEASPGLLATGQYAHTQSRFDQYGLAAPGGPAVPLRDRDNVLTAGISITLPFRNRNQGNIEAAVARSRAASLRREALERSARQETLAAISRYDAARRALELFDRGVLGQSQENLRIVKGAYDLGELRLLDVINEQRRVLETQRAYTDLLRDANVALAELERAIGAPLKEVLP
ncbi:MAG TPA: TolC family protein [Bryobacteraceae bacterium]|nr:TolC family protein [Bryobacteraceae bacterium]